MNDMSDQLYRQYEDTLRELAAVTAERDDLRENGQRLMEAADGWRTDAQRLQGIERNLKRAEERVSELMHNQRIQDGVTAAVMERAERAEAECERLRLPAELTLSAHPGCAFCMMAGTSVRAGEVCPKCGDRLPTADAGDGQSGNLLDTIAALQQQLSGSLESERLALRNNEGLRKQVAELTRSAETAAWLIEYRDGAVVHRHNAIADYRTIFDDATVTELIRRPK